MSSVREIIDTIRKYVNANHPSATGGSAGEELQTISVEEFNRLDGLAQGYAAICHDINERAYQCQEFLGRGQRKEAVQLAKNAPDLKAIAQAVDFRERGLWLDICEEYELPFPDIIDTDIVTVVIDEAYGQKRTIQSLLMLHRRMALGKAPLADRLRVLRKLCKADAANVIWRDDLGVLEPARVEELIKTAERANRDGDLVVLETIQRELASDEWLNPPTKALLGGVADMIKPHRGNLASERYRKLVTDIRAAHGSMDEDRCRLLIELWYGVEQTTGFRPGAKLAEDVAPVEEWLEELSQAKAEDDAYDMACIALEQAIDEDHSRDNMEKFAANILRCDRGMPDLLAARFNSKMEELARVAKRKFALRLTGVIVALLMLGAGITLGILRYNKSKELARWRDQIAAAVDKGDMNAAAKLFTSLNSKAPEFAHDPDIESLRAKRDQIVKKETDRKDEFEQCMARVAKAGDEQPDEESLKRAGTLAMDFREKSMVQEWHEKIQKCRDTTTAQRRAAIKTQMDRLDVLYTAVMASSSLDAVAVEAKVKECVDLADEIEKLPGVDSPTSTRLASIRKHSAEFAKKERDRANRRNAIERRFPIIVRSCHMPKSFAAALRKFAEDYPDHLWAADFIKAAGMSDHWIATQQWQAIVSKWNGEIRITTPEQAAERKAQIDDYLKSYGSGPCAGIAAKCSEYFGTAIAALGDDGPKNLSGISRVFAGTAMSGLGMIKTKDGWRYYYQLSKPPGEMKFNNVVTAYRVEYIYDLDLSTKKVSIKVGDMTARPGPAPQVLLAASVQKLITNFKGGGWETFYVELADRVLADKNVDPILKAQLLKMLLTQAMQCDPCKTEEIKKTNAILEGLYLDDLGWINPVDTEANQKRKMIQGVLDRMKQKPFGDIVRSIDSELKGLIAGPAGYEPAGVIMGKAREVRLGASVDNGVMYVVRADSQQQSSLHRIGEVAKGQAKMDLTEAAKDPIGTLVFVKKSK